MPTISDENEYRSLRRQILAITTASEHARASRIASQMDYNQTSSTIRPLVKIKLAKRQNKDNPVVVCLTHPHPHFYELLFIRFDQ